MQKEQSSAATAAIAQGRKCCRKHSMRCEDAAHWTDEGYPWLTGQDLGMGCRLAMHCEMKWDKQRFTAGRDAKRDVLACSMLHGPF